MFITEADFNKIDRILDTSNNQVDQCSQSNEKACLDQLLKEISDGYFVKEKFSSSTNTLISIKEGQYKFGVKYGFHRENDATQSDLAWFNAGNKNGKTLRVLLQGTRTICQKRLYDNGSRGAVWSGNDISTSGI